MSGLEHRADFGRARREAAYEPPTSWVIEVCSRCRKETDYDRDYGGPHVSDCPYEDCACNRDRYYGMCPGTVAVMVVEAGI